MKNTKRICVIAVAVMLAVISTFVVSAKSHPYKKAYECTKDELYNEVWNVYADLQLLNGHDHSKPLDDITAVIASRDKFYLKNYLEDYTPLNHGVSIANVANEFIEYMKKELEGVDTIDYGDDGKIYETYTDGSKYLWTYDAETDKFTRTDSDGKVIESYDRYHPDYEKISQPKLPLQQNQLHRNRIKPTMKKRYPNKALMLSEKKLKQMQKHSRQRQKPKLHQMTTE